MSKILLTGASGALGTHLRRWFAEHGREFVATDIRAPTDGGEVVIADLSDRSAVDGLMAGGISAVVHFGAQSKEAGWEEILGSNIAATYKSGSAGGRAARDLCLELPCGRHV